MTWPHCGVTKNRWWCFFNIYIYIYIYIYMRACPKRTKPSSWLESIGKIREFLTVKNRHFAGSSPMFKAHQVTILDSWIPWKSRFKSNPCKIHVFPFGVFLSQGGTPKNHPILSLLQLQAAIGRRGLRHCHRCDGVGRRYGLESGAATAAGRAGVADSGAVKIWQKLPWIESH